VLEVDNLMVFFENALAINGLSMAVEPGEIIGVIRKARGLHYDPLQMIECPFDLD